MPIPIQLTTDGIATNGLSPSASWQQPRVTDVLNQRSPPTSRHRQYAKRRTLDDEVDAISASTDGAANSFMNSTIRYSSRG